MLIRVASLLLFAAGVAGCAALRSTGHGLEQERTIVEVENQGFADMAVFIVDGGRRTRIGMAAGHSTTELTIAATLVGGGRQLRFLADPIGSSRTSISQEIFVQPGDRVLLIIPPR